jgi:hypothetical protein
VVFLVVIAGLSDDLSTGALMITIALSFDSGILFCAAAKNSVPARTNSESTNIFLKQYGAKSGDGCSIFLLSEPIDFTVAAVQYCEYGLDFLQPADLTIERMRVTIENSLSEIYQRQPGVTMLVALYSSSDRKYSVYRTSGAALKELAGYDCQGSAAYLGHYLIRDRYRAMQSMDTLDLRSVFAVAAETLDGVRDFCQGCAECAEILVLYANGRKSGVQRIWRGRRELPELALPGESGTRSAIGSVADYAGHLS